MTESYSSKEWVSIALEALAQTDGSAPAVAEFITRSVGASAGGLGAAYAAAVAELAQYAQGRADETSSSLDEEREAVELSRRVVRPLFEARLQHRLDALDEQMSGASCCARCGGMLQSEGRPERGWGSLLGPITLHRRYRSCAQCERGEAPAQKALGLPQEHFTARLEEAVTMMATTVPHEMAQALAHKLCGIEVSKKAVEDMTERRAERLLVLQRAESERYAPYDESGLPRPDEQRPTDAVAVREAPEVAYLEMDGVLPVTREPLPPEQLSGAERERLRAAEQSKARGGKGRRYTIVGKEVKNAVLYRGADCAKESPQRGCLLDKTYVSYLGSWTAFAALLWVELSRLRFDQAKLLVILSDGAEWIRSIAQWLPFPTLLILDLYHVKHRILEVAHALYGDRCARAAAWAHAQYDRIDAGQALTVIDALRFVEPPTADATEKVDELKTYLRNNLDRMHYPEYRARGLRISSAAVESANFHVTGQRLKCQGMRWDESGARRMAALRADLFNGRWEHTTKRILAA